MLERVHWVSVMVSAAGTFLSLLILAGFHRWVVLPYIQYITTDLSRGPGRKLIRTWTSGEQWDRYQALGDLSLLCAVLLALFLFCFGSLAVGRAVPSFPGTNGATTAALALGLAFACLLAGTLPWVLNPWVHPGTRFEKLGFLTNYGALLCYVFPFAILSGYLGGALGGRFRSRAAGRSAS